MVRMKWKIFQSKTHQTKHILKRQTILKKTYTRRELMAVSTKTFFHSTIFIVKKKFHSWRWKARDDDGNMSALGLAATAAFASLNRAEPYGPIALFGSPGDR